jgi:hypothetical protein
MALTLAIVLLSAFLVLCVFVYTDIVEECEWQSRDADE